MLHVDRGFGYSRFTVPKCRCRYFSAGVGNIIINAGRGGTGASCANAQRRTNAAKKLANVCSARGSGLCRRFLPRCSTAPLSTIPSTRIIDVEPSADGCTAAKEEGRDDVAAAGVKVEAATPATAGSFDPQLVGDNRWLYAALRWQWNSLAYLNGFTLWMQSDERV